MSGNRVRLRSRITPRHLVVAAFVALALVVSVATFLPDGGHRDGELAPVTQREYAATTGAPGPGAITPAARAEIERVLDESPARISARTTLRARAQQLMRCAEFEGQRYCLGRGWTTAEPAEVHQTAAAPARRTAAGTPETTGDLTDADFLAQRAAMPATARRAAERTELEAAARSVAKVVLLRHQLLGEPLPEGFLARHPEARSTTAQPVARQTQASPRRRLADYPERATVLRARRTSSQARTYWCGPATMQMITWGWTGDRRNQKYWANRLGTTTSGSAISEMVRVVNEYTGWDDADRAGEYVVLDISEWSYRQWVRLTMRHVVEYRAPMVYHPILLKRFYPYLDDDASGHFQVGRGYDKRGDKPAHVGYFEPWNQQRFDPSEPYIAPVQWRSAYRSYRANQAHPHQNIGV